nr:hypothetical protein CFP56_41309 [Quercus suber]
MSTRFVSEYGSLEILSLVKLHRDGLMSLQPQCLLFDRTDHLFSPPSPPPPLVMTEYPTHLTGPSPRSARRSCDHASSCSTSTTLIPKSVRGLRWTCNRTPECCCLPLSPLSRHRQLDAALSP